jgi:hypothetical protein
MNESNLRVELEEVWVPKDAGELEGLLLAIQNEPGKRILKHRIQEIVKEKAEIRKNWGDQGWEDSVATDWSDDSDDSVATDWENHWDDTFEPPGSDDSESW